MMTIKMFAFGTLGGVLPSLAALAPTYVAAPTTPLPTIGLLFGLALWAIVGGVMALTNTAAEARHAIFAGIAAPAILANVIAGATSSPPVVHTAIVELNPTPGGEPIETKSSIAFDFLWVLGVQRR